MNTLVHLETSRIRLDFDSSNGSLVGIYSKLSQWNVIKRPYLGLSWRLMIPLEGRRNNNAWGHLQPIPPKCTCTDHSISFEWEEITSEYGGRHEIAVRTVCCIEHDQPVFHMQIDNRDCHVVENVYYPYIGDLYRPEGCKNFYFEHGAYCDMKRYEMYPTFPNQAGTHSTDYPTLCVEDHINPPMNPFGLISDDNGNGFYLGVAERRMETVTWYGEYLPGWSNSDDFRVFDEDCIGDKDCYIRFAVGHLPFVAPGTQFDLLPFSMDCYQGNWNVGADCYTQNSRRWNRLPDTIPEWAKHPHSWYQVQINSPEDELRVRFCDLPELAKECKKYGVQAIQLVGWNDGGQDRGNPSHTPDPRLGSFEELKQAIHEIQKLGIKLILFAKFTWADQSREDFSKVYEPLAIKDPYQNAYVYKGYQYMTLSQMTNVSTRRLIPMCFGSEQYRQICLKEFQKCVELGADGILFDECLHHSPTLCCFDTSHGHRYGESVYRWDEQLIAEFRKLVGDREFMIAGEALYDFQHNYYDLSYTRTWGRKHLPTSRYLRPDCNIMSAVVGFQDREMINKCLKNRYIISYEPYHFKGKLSDYPETIAYGSKMDQLRTDLREYFWDGTFTGQLHGNVRQIKGQPWEDYSVFLGTNRKYGMIICNHDEEKSIRVIPTLENGTSFSQYRLVDEEELHHFNRVLTIPPRSAAAVI